jgi:DNA polymerase
MNRQAQILQAMGLGPVWLARDGFFSAHPRALPLESVAAYPQHQAAPEQEDFEPAQPCATTAAALRSLVPDQTPELTPVAPVLPTAHPTPLSWKQLEQAVSVCDHCRLCKTRTQTVFGRGNPQARWLLVGEAPGEQEDRQGLPFVGRAGQLLDNMLQAAQLSSQDEVYIANVLKCRPPGNRNPQADEILACRDYLQQQIHHIQPGIIVALGRFAAQTLLATEQSISRLRGQAHSYQGIPLIVTYHPAYLLRNPPDKDRAWADWLLARQTLAANTGA